MSGYGRASLIVGLSGLVGACRGIGSWSWSRLLARRLFPWRLDVPPRWMTVYRREWLTPELGPNGKRTLVNAF